MAAERRARGGRAGTPGEVAARLAEPKKSVKVRTAGAARVLEEGASEGRFPDVVGDDEVKEEAAKKERCLI